MLDYYERRGRTEKDRAAAPVKRPPADDPRVDPATGTYADMDALVDLWGMQQGAPVMAG